MKETDIIQVGKRCLITRGRYKGELGEIIGTQIDANYTYLVHIRRDSKPRIRKHCIAVELHCVEVQP